MSARAHHVQFHRKLNPVLDLAKPAFPITRSRGGEGRNNARMDISLTWAGGWPAVNPGGRCVSLDDHNLVERARAGDQLAFAQLFEQYNAPILNYLHRMVSDRALAEDLTQDTFYQKPYNALPRTSLTLRSRRGFIGLPPTRRSAICGEERSSNGFPS